MKYVVIPEPGKVEIREMDAPELTEGNAILRILYGGLCGSDIGTYKGSFLYAKYPCIPGHEFSAEIIDIGNNSFGLREGMVVTANPYFNCGHCYSCRRGYVNCCNSNETMGLQRDGAFMEYISLPVERIYDGRGLPAKTLSIIEPFCIGYHAAMRVGISPGDKVLVVGAGTIGCLAASSAALLGGEVYICDVSAHKLEHAKSLDVAGIILNSGEDSFLEQVRLITGGDGFDVCMECVGLPSTFMNCIDAASYRGRIAVVGVGKQSLDFFYSILQTKELDILGSRNAAKQDFLQVIEKVESGAVKLDSIVSATYDFKDAHKAFRDFVESDGDLLKVMLRF